MRYRCVNCGRTAARFEGFQCGCGGFVEVEHSFPPVSPETFDGRLGCAEGPYRSGVWRYKELIDPEISEDHVVSRPEGNTNIYTRAVVSAYAGIKRLVMKHEGENPTGSFKDREMTVAVSEALRAGAETLVCASTGNTSASMAAYAAQAGLRAAVLVPEGEIALGKLAQALAYGARVIQVRGHFDDAMRLVREASKQLNLHVLNSLNPWRIEGQKSIVFEALQQLRWSPPDWIVVPAGNLGNTSGFGKALKELGKLGIIESAPRIAAVQAEGANPFYRLWRDGGSRLEPVNPSTVASAIKIGAPVNWFKALDAVKSTGGVVEQVSDSEILEAKAVVDAAGVGCEPASAASVAGARKLRKAGVIEADEEVLCVLTGNILKDPETTLRFHLGELGSPGRVNKPVTVDADLGSMEEALRTQK